MAAPPAVALPGANCGANLPKIAMLFGVAPSAKNSDCTARLRHLPSLFISFFAPWCSTTNATANKHCHFWCKPKHKRSPSTMLTIITNACVWLPSQFHTKSLLRCQAFMADYGKQKVMEYEDRIGVTKEGDTVMTLFYMCPRCGIYMNSKLWKVKGQNLTSGQKWYCGINWVEFEQSYPQEWRTLMLQHDNLPALERRMRDTFCGCRYRPYACGSASILEWMDLATGHWTCLTNLCWTRSKKSRKTSPLDGRIYPTSNSMPRFPSSRSKPTSFRSTTFLALGDTTWIRRLQSWPNKNGANFA